MLHGYARGAFCFFLLYAAGLSWQSELPQERWEEDTVSVAIPKGTGAQNSNRPRDPGVVAARRDSGVHSETVLERNHTKPKEKSTKSQQGNSPAVTTEPGFICSMPNGCNLAMDFPKQKNALLSLHKATQGAKWRVPKGYEWKAATSMCNSWAGVSCDPWGRVVSLSLHGFGLQGTLPPQIDDLTSLSSLDLGTNMLSGSLPSFAAASNLTYIYLNQNRFSGTLSPKLARHTIRHIELSQNKLGGDLPKEIAQMDQLAYFDISANEFVSLPSSSAAVLTKLTGSNLNRKCDLTQNHFKCPIPEALKHPAPCGAICGDYLDLI